MKNVFSFLCFITMLIKTNASAAADIFDDITGRLTIPIVEALGVIYNDVVINIGDVLSVEPGKYSKQFDFYNAASNSLYIPAVKAFGRYYYNVNITVGDVLEVGGIGFPKKQSNIVWRQTANSVNLPDEVVTSYIGRAGFGAFNIYETVNKSFIIPSGTEFITDRLPTDNDFTVLTITEDNYIFLDNSPVRPKYIAGYVNTILSGNFGFGDNSLLFIDTGRENNYEDRKLQDYSYLWRMDKVNDEWVVNEFSQEIGRGFWHGSQNPLDINNDGVLDFVVANLNGPISDDYHAVLFLSNGNGNNPSPIDLTRYLCADNRDEFKNVGSAALIKLADGTFAASFAPYLANEWERARYGSIIHFDKSDAKVTSVECFDVRETDFTKEVNDRYGYNQIKVLDINSDGLEDFIVIGEIQTSINVEHIMPVLVFLQNPDSSFEFYNEKVELPLLYKLPNIDTSSQYSDWLGNEFMVIDINGDGVKDLFNFTQLVKFNNFIKYGIRGGILNSEVKLENYTIAPEKILLNEEKKPFQYRYILPAEINNDDVVDFILIENHIDQNIISESNPYGFYFKASALLSQISL